MLSQVQELPIERPRSHEVRFQEPRVTDGLAEALLSSRSVVVLRPWHGVRVHGDMAGDYGAAYPGDDPRPDLSIVGTCAILKAAGKTVDAIEDDKRRESVSGLPDADVVLLKVTLPTWRHDLEVAQKLAACGLRVGLFGATVRHLEPGRWYDRIEGDAFTALSVLWGNPSPVRVGHAYSLFDLAKYRTPKGKIRIHLHGSRGCNRVCNYCPYIRTFGRWSGRAIEEIADDIGRVMKLGASVLQFRDPDFASNRSHTERICQVLGEVGKGRLKWIAEGNLDRFDIDIANQMAEAGCVELIVGIESANEGILRKAKRASSMLKDLADRVAVVTQAGIRVRGLFVIGLPGESWSTIVQTANLSARIGLDAAQFNVYSPLPGERFGTARRATLGDFAPYSNSYTPEMPETIPKQEAILAAKFCRRFFCLKRAGRDRIAGSIARRMESYAQATDHKI